MSLFRSYGFRLLNIGFFIFYIFFWVDRGRKNKKRSTGFHILLLAIRAFSVQEGLDLMNRYILHNFARSNRISNRGIEIVL